MDGRSDVLFVSLWRASWTIAGVVPERSGLL